MFISISEAAHDLDALGRLAYVPYLIASVTGVMVLAFTLLSIDDSGTSVPWFGTAMWTGAVVAIALGWFAIRVRKGSTVTIGSGALTFSLGVLLVWLSPVGGPDILMGTAFVLMILAASSWWAFFVARILHSRFPGCFIRPHATRRLSLPRDTRALGALGPALLGSLHVLSALSGAIVLAPFLRQGALSVSLSIFMQLASEHFRQVRAVLALRAQEIRLKDRRLPVLLLRSFGDDELQIQRTKGLFLANLTRTKLSLEEQIIAHLWEIGPVIAIGQPGLKIDPIGAARERIVGPLWQTRVRALIEESALVVVVLGQTEGLFWEYEQLAQHPVSVLAILPPGDANVLSDRWQRFTRAYLPARSIVLEFTFELPLLVWFRACHEPDRDGTVARRAQLRASVSVGGIRTRLTNGSRRKLSLNSANDEKKVECSAGRTDGAPRHSIRAPLLCQLICDFARRYANSATPQTRGAILICGQHHLLANRGK